MRDPIVLAAIAVAVVAGMLAAALPIDAVRRALIAVAAMALMTAVVRVVKLRRPWDPYDLRALRELQERSELDEFEEPEIAEDAEVVCLGCGETYRAAFAICPRCRRPQGP